MRKYSVQSFEVLPSIRYLKWNELRQLHIGWLHFLKIINLKPKDDKKFNK